MSTSTSALPNGTCHPRYTTRQRSMSLEVVGKRKHADMEADDADMTGSNEHAQYKRSALSPRHHSRRVATAAATTATTLPPSPTEPTLPYVPAQPTPSVNPTDQTACTAYFTFSNAFLPASLSSPLATTHLATNYSDTVHPQTVRPLQQGIRRRHRPTPLHATATMAVPQYHGLPTPVTPEHQATDLDARMPNDTDSSDFLIIDERALATTPSLLSNPSTADWRNIDANVRRMDDMFGASFHAWLRNEANLWVSAGYLQRLASEYPPERTAQALDWMTEGWSLQSSATLRHIVMQQCKRRIRSCHCHWQQ